MTAEQARDLYDNGVGYIQCEKCPLEKEDDYCPIGCTGREGAYQAIVDYYADHPELDPTLKVENEEPTLIPTEDVINSPNHYCRDGAMECIEEMILLFGKETVKHFCLCNIWKYRYRSAAKNGEEDIKKSDKYVEIYQRLCSDE